MRWTQKIIHNTRADWRRWFAWFPVNVAGRNAYPGTFLWMVAVERRLENNLHGDDYWAYREIAMPETT